MKAIKFYRCVCILLLLVVGLSCEDEFPKYSTITYVACDDTNVIVDSNILSDFECQANIKFEGVETLRNPSETPTNTSKFVGKLIDGPGALDNIEIDYGAPIDLSTHTVFKLKLKTEVSGNLLVRLEGGTSDLAEISAAVSGDNGWAEYVFDFSTRQGENHTKLVLFFNEGVETGGADVYYIDDVFFDDYLDPCRDVPKDLNIISDFECQQNYNLGNGVDSVLVVNNPDVSGTNTSNSVGEYTDDGTNASDNLIIDYGSEIDLSVYSQLNIKIYSSRTAPLLAKLEGGTTAEEIYGTIDVIGAWKNYKFDFSTAAGNGNTKVVLFFNTGASDGTSTDQYYIDDIRFLQPSCDDAIVENCSGITPDLNIISDFDCQQNYSLGAVGDSAPVVDNPNVSCGNRSSNVGKYTDDGTDAWDSLIIDYGAIIDLSTNNKLKFKIYSPSSIQVLAKLEGGIAQEIWSDFSAVNTWQEFTFDFSAAAGNGNKKVVLFFNGAVTTGTPTDIYYIDDLRWE